MKDFQRKHKIRQALYSIPSIILVCLLAFFLAKGAVGMMNKKHQNALRVKELEEMAASLALREENLKEDIAALQTNEGVRSEIRERFSVVAEGEHVAVIVDDRRATTSVEDENTPWYKKLWAAIMRQ